MLQVKTGLFLLVIVLSLVRDFFLRPRVLAALKEARAGNSSPSGRGSRVLLLTFVRVNLVLVLLILMLSVFLIRP